jgi:hypothetical protein
MSYLSTPGVGKAWNEAWANNLSHNYESFQVGGCLICPPQGLEKRGAKPGPQFLKILKTYEKRISSSLSYFDPSFFNFFAKNTREFLCCVNSFLPPYGTSFLLRYVSKKSEKNDFPMSSDYYLSQ